MKDMKLLTIAIPTHNRSQYLDTNLFHLCGQLKKDESRLQILISDNNSTDKTSEIVNKYISRGFDITYQKNDENIGADNNFIQCFTMSKGKYVLIMGDDDILLEGAVENILNILEKSDYGIVYLSSYPFKENFIAEKPQHNLSGYIVYNDINKFIKKISYSLTFISANIINKSLVDPAFDPKTFLNTDLVQLGWTYSALFNSKQNVFIKDYLLAYKMYNSGGYALCKTFGVNLNKISTMLINNGMDKEVFEIINKKLISNFFPANIIRARKNLMNTIEEDYFRTLYPIYHKYLYFWIFTIPAIFLPLNIADILLSFAKTSRNIILKTRSAIARSFPS